MYVSESHSPDYMIRGGQEYQFVKDHLGSVKLVVRVSDGTVMQNITYDEFGRVLSDSNPGFQPFGFAGGVYDAQTGLTKFGARDYDAEVGRWLTKDPILFHGGDANLYGYVMMDPVNWVDPSGTVNYRATGKIILGGTLIVGGAVLGGFGGVGLVCAGFLTAADGVSDFGKDAIDGFIPSIPQSGPSGTITVP